MKDFEISALPEERVSFGRDILSVPVIVAALGYFVDIYDLILFSIVRVQSLKAIGLSGQELLDKGVYLLNMQMAGSQRPSTGERPILSEAGSAWLCS